MLLQYLNQSARRQFARRVEQWHLENPEAEHCLAVQIGNENPAAVKLANGCLQREQSFAHPRWNGVSWSTAAG
jgi:hypothetical protein